MIGSQIHGRCTNLCLLDDREDESIVNYLDRAGRALAVHIGKLDVKRLRTYKPFQRVYLTKFVTRYSLSHCKKTNSRNETVGPEHSDHEETRIA